MTSTTNQSLSFITGEARRYKLHALASSSTDLVISVGGLIFDAVMSGWEVTAGLRGCFDDRPLRLLGARVTDSRSLLGHVDRTDAPCIVAVAVDLYLDDQSVRQYVDRTLEQHRGEVIMFGEWTQVSLDFSPVERICSHAAQIFKSHAANLADGAQPNSSIEAFGRSSLSGPPAVAGAGRYLPALLNGVADHVAIGS